MPANFTLPSAVWERSSFVMRVVDAFAFSLVEKLKRSRAWVMEDDGLGFSDENFRRVERFLHDSRQLLGFFDGSAGSDGSIGLLFERGQQSLYADFLNNGKIRVFTRSADGVESRYITEDPEFVNTQLRSVAPLPDSIVINMQGRSDFGLMIVDANPTRVVTIGSASSNSFP